MSHPALAEDYRPKKTFARDKAEVPVPTLAHVEQAWFTEADYLKREKTALYKNEFHPTGQVLIKGKLVTVGTIVAMAGAKRAHNVISANVIVELGGALKGKPCTVHTSDQRIQIPSTGRYVYPDISVICTPLESPDKSDDTATNPSVLVEVLSESTANYDRGTKFLNYQQLPSLREYLLVSTTEALVECFRRQENGSWSCEKADSLEQSLRLESIGVTLSLAEVYDKVNFAPL